ncbi:MAG: hypothetical protein ACI9FJ_000806 [Alteromonadaceae bacterium]|jgi:hypothetical protein
MPLNSFGFATAQMTCDQVQDNTLSDVFTLSILIINPPQKIDSLKRKPLNIRLLGLTRLKTCDYVVLIRQIEVKAH